MKKITCFNTLLMGQGGSSKTAVVQEIILRTFDFLFGCETTLIVCKKWSQAENISTDTNKAISCHRAASIGIQSYRNAKILHGDNKQTLVRRWEPLRCLILEEVNMIGPGLYNLLLFRSFHGRRKQWNVVESDYDKLKRAFGRMPMVIHLGDFLQKKPIGGAFISLTDDVKERERSGKHLRIIFRIPNGDEALMQYTGLFRAPSFQSHSGTETTRSNGLHPRSA